MAEVTLSHLELIPSTVAMDTGVHIQEPVLNTLRREGENEKLMDQASNIILGKIPVEGNIGPRHAPIEAPDTLETKFEVRDLVKGNEGSASTIEGEKFLKSPSAEEVYFEENNLTPDASQVTGDVEKMATEQTDIGEAKLDAEESNGLEKGSASEWEIEATREAGHDESMPGHEAGLSDNKEDRESTILKKEAAHLESLNVNPEDAKTCVTVHDTKTTSSVEEKSMTSTSQEIPGEKIEQTTFDTNLGTPENISTVVPNEETVQNLSIKLDDSQMKTDENLEKEEDEKLESTLVPERKIKDGESKQNELFESKEDTKTVIQKCEEVIKSSSVAASEAEDIKTSTSDNKTSDDIKACGLVQDTETKSSTEDKLPTATPREIWGQTSFDTKEEIPEDISTNVSNEETEQNSIVEVPFITEALTADNELAITEGKINDEYQREKDLLENKNETESELLKQEVTEKPVESSQIADEAENTKVSISDHETKISALENQILTENPLHIVTDERESKPCDAVETKKETLDAQDVSTIESNDAYEENSVIKEDESEKPLFIEESIRYFAGDQSTCTHEDKTEDKDQRRAELIENQESTECVSLIEDNTIPKLAESPQVDAEDIKTHVLDQDAETTGLILASKGNSNDGESVVKYEVKTEDDDQKEDPLRDSEKNLESDVLLEAAQIETPIESLKKTLPSKVPQGFLDDKTEEKTVDAIQKDEEILDVQNVTKTVPNEKIEENPSIQMDGSQIQHGEYLEKERETPSLIGDSTKNANDDELIITDEDTIEHEDLESKKDAEINLQKNQTQIETHITPLQLAAGDIIASDLYQGTETTNSQEKRILNENEIMHEQTDVERVDTTHTKKETPEPLHDVSTIVLNEDHGENLLLREDESQMKNEENFGEEIKKPSLIEESKTYASRDESTNKREDKSEGEVQMRAESLEDKRDTESTLWKEEETAAQSLGSPKVVVEDLKTYVSDQGTETAGLVEVLEGVSSDDEPEIKRTEEEDPKKVELCDTENIPDSALLLEAAQMEKPFESSKEDLPTLVPRGFLDENIEENVTTTVSKENIEDDSSLQVNGSQIQCKTCSEEQSEITTIIEGSTKNINDDISEAQVEMSDKSSNIAAEDIIASGSCQETETSSQEERNLNEEETVCEQIDVETLNTTDTKTQTSEAKDVPIIVPNDDSGQISVTEENDLQMKNEGTFGKETEKPSVTEGDADDESAVKNEVQAEDNDRKQDELSDNEKNPESGELLEAAQTKKPLESLQETLPSTIPWGFLDAIQKDEDIQNVPTTVSNEKIQENSVIQMDGSHIQNEEYLEKEHEIPPVIEASTEHANDDELIAREDNIEHENLRKVELLESEKDTEINLQEDEAQIKTHIKSSLAKDIIASDSYHGMETTDSQEERILNEKEIVHEETEVEKLDEAESKKEAPEAPHVSTIRLIDDNEENLVMAEDDSETKNEEILGKDSENPYFMEASPMDASGDGPAKKCEDKVEGEEQTTAEDTKSTLLKEGQPLDLTQVDAEDIKTYVSDQGTETTGLVEVFEEVANDNHPEVKCTIRTEDKDQILDELCDNEKIPDNTLHLEVEETEKESEIPSAIEASTKHADEDELTSIHEDNVEHKEPRKVELLESKEDTEFNLQKDEVQMETPVNSVQVAAEDIMAPDSYRGTEPTSQEVKLLNENEIVCEQTEVDRPDTADSDKGTNEAQNFVTLLPSENINENSRIPEDGSELKHEELFEKENKAPPLSETLTMEANDQVPEIIHQDKIEHEKIEKVDKVECDKHEEITLSNKDAIAEKLNESSKEYLEDIKDTVPGEKTTERSLIEVQSLNENQREIVNNQMENIVDKDPEKIEDEHLKKDVMLENETQTEIGFIKEEAAKKLQEPDEKDIEQIKTFVSHEGTETTSSMDEQDLTEISQENVADPWEDKIHDQEIPDFTPIVPDEYAEKNSSTQPDGSQMKHEELSEKECEMLSTPETSFLYSSSNEPTTIDVENIENEHFNKVDEFEDEKHTKITIINYQAPAEEPLLEEIKAFVSGEATEMSSIEEQGLPETSQEIMGDQSEEKIFDKVRTTQEFTKFVSDENGEDISLMLVDESQIKHEELLEKDNETSPLSEISLQNSKFNESMILHQDKTEDELLNRVDKFESEKHAEISLTKEETPLEKLNKLSLRKDLEEIKAFDLSEATEASSTRKRSLTAVPQENDFTSVDASQIKHELLERESETPPLPLLHSSNVKSAIVHTGKTEGGVLEKADKSECMESGEATLLNEEALAEKNAESSKDLEGIKESISCDETEITSSTDEKNLTISQETVDDQVEEKVPNVVGEASDFTAFISDNTTEKNLLVEVDASQMKHEEHLEKESEIPSSLMLNTSIEEPKIVHENKIMEHTEIILSNEGLDNSSKEENENIKSSVLCEDTEKSCTEQESLIEYSNEIVGDQVKEKIIDMAQNASDTSTSDKNVEENSSIQSNESQIKHKEPWEKESETPSMSMLDTKTEESTILQDRIIDDQDFRKVDKFESEKDAEATLLQEPALAEKVTESAKDDLENTKVFLSREDKEITSSIEDPSQKANQQEIVVDQTQENILDSATKAEDFKQTVSHENAENSLIQVDESQVKHEIMIDQTQENVLNTALKDQDFKPAISHEKAEENTLIQVDELQLKHDDLEKESETPSLLIADTSNVHEDIIEDESLKKIHDLECEKHEEITSTEEETLVTKVHESSKEDLKDIKALVSGGDSETASFEEKQSLKENPREILSDQQEEKVLDIAPEAQNFIKVVSNENVEKDSVVQEDGSKMEHEEILEKEAETPSLSSALILNTTSEITREVDMVERGKHVDGKTLDAAPEASETTINVLDEKTEEKPSNQVDKSQAKHEELLEKESNTLSLSETTLLNTSNEDSTTIKDDKIEDEDPEKVDKLECEKHTEVPLTKEEEPVQKLSNPSKEDIEKIKAFVSCLDTETTSYTEDRSLELNPKEVVGDQMDDTIIDSTPEPQNFKTLVSEENAKKNLSLAVDQSQIKHKELSEIESEKPSLSILRTSNEELSFIRDSKTDNEDVKRDEKVEQINDFPEGGPDNIKVSVPSENLETTSPIEEGSLTENPQENLTKDKILDVVPEAQELKTIVSDKNIEENSFILEDGSHMKHEEHLEKDSEMPSLMETLIANTGIEEPTLFLDDKIEDEDQAKVNKSESEKHAEITEVPVEKESEMPSLTEMSIPSTRNEDKKLFPDDKMVDEDQAKLKESESAKHAEITEVPVEKESEMPSLKETSILRCRNEEPTLFLDDKIEDEDQAKVHKSESEKHAEITEVPVENPNSSKLENIETFVPCEDIEPTHSTEGQSLTVNPLEIEGGQKEEKVLDKALEATDFTPIVPNDNDDNNPSIQVDGSQMKHEEPLEKESNNVPSLLETSLLNTNNEDPETSHKDKIEGEALKNVDEFESKKCSEINKLKEEAQVEEYMAYKDIKAYVSYQDTEASDLHEQIVTANQQDILGNRSEDNVIDTTDSKEKITENLTVSNENAVKDSLTQKDESEIKHEEILEKEPNLAKTLALDANEESTIIHEDKIEEGSGKIIESTPLKEGSGEDEFVESLQVISEDIKVPVSCQKTDTPTSYLNADPQDITGDVTDDKITTAGTRELPLEALSLTKLVSNKNELLDSITPQDGLEIEHEQTSLLADNKESIIIHEDAVDGGELKNVDTGEQQTENTLLKEETREDESMDSLQVASEPIKESVSRQDRDPTSSFDEKILTTTTTQIVGDRVEEKVADTNKTWEETPEVSSSILVFQEDEANRIGVDDINRVMIKDEEILNQCTASNAAENDEICSSDKVQAKEEEMEIISKMAIDEEDIDDTWIELTDDDTNKTYVEEKEIDVLSHGKDTFEITRHDGAKDIPKGNENSTAKNEFLEDESSNGSTESTAPVVNEDVEQINKDIKAEIAITETGAASSALPITGVQCGPEENDSEDSKVKETETSLATKGREYQGQHTKLHESPSPPLPHVKDYEWEMAQKRGGDDLQSGDYTNYDMKKLDEGSVAISDERNFLEAKSNKSIETEVTAGEKEASAIQHNPVSEFVVQEIEEQPGKTVEAVPEEKGVKCERGEINFDDSNNLEVTSNMVTDKVAPSDILCRSTTYAGQSAVGQETQIVVQEKEQKPGKGKAIEAVPEEKGINTKGDEIKEHNFNEGGRASATDKLTVLRADQIDNEDSSLGSNKIPLLQHGDSSENSHTEGEKQKESEPEEKSGKEETAKQMETSESTEMNKPSLSGLLQESMKEVSKVVDHSIDEKGLTTKEEELQAEKSAEVEEHVEEKTYEEKDGEEESCVHQISDSSSDTPVMVDAVDKDVKVAHKKSHGILSGVGSKVKHSISKVKKAITGKSSHPKSASPKYSEKL